MEQKVRIARPGPSGHAGGATDERAGGEPSSEQIFEWTDGARIGIVALAAVAAWLRIGEILPHLNPIAIVGILIGGWPVFKEAAENLSARRMTMELSMSIAIVAAAAIAEYFNALIITLFVLI